MPGSVQEEVQEDQAWGLAAPDLYRLGLFWRPGMLHRVVTLHRGLAELQFRARGRRPREAAHLEERE